MTIVVLLSALFAVGSAAQQKQEQPGELSLGEYARKLSQEKSAKLGEENLKQLGLERPCPLSAREPLGRQAQQELALGRGSTPEELAKSVWLSQTSHDWQVRFFQQRQKMVQVFLDFCRAQEGRASSRSALQKELDSYFELYREGWRSVHPAAVDPRAQAQGTSRSSDNVSRDSAQGDFVISLTGTPGLPVTGTCTASSGQSTKSLSFDDVLPAEHVITGAITVGCSFVKKYVNGTLKMQMLRNGVVIDEAETSASYGVVSLWP